MIEEQGKTLVVDTGPDFRQQMLRENVKVLDAVLMTHQHMDHIAGLDDIRAYNYFLKRDMHLYLNKPTEDAIRRVFAYIFEITPYPGIPLVKLHSIGNDTFDAEGITVTPITVLHHKMPVTAYRIGDFTYITDANFIAPEEKEKIKGSKILVLNALRKEPHISHFTLAEALALVEELKPERAYLTHMSHQMGLHAEIEATLPANVHLAYDGLSISI